MTDPTVSLQAAASLVSAKLASYLEKTGWQRERSNTKTRIFSKQLPGADLPVHVVLPGAGINRADTVAHIAAGLRALEVVEERPISAIVQAIEPTEQKRDSAPVRPLSGARWIRGITASEIDALKAANINQREDLIKAVRDEGRLAKLTKQTGIKPMRLRTLATFQREGLEWGARDIKPKRQKQKQSSPARGAHADD